MPEGYELITTGDFFVKDFEGKTTTITLQKIVKDTIINVVYVDEEGNVIGGGDFFVDPDGDGIANYSELTLPVGYELITTGDFSVENGASYTITLRAITTEEGNKEDSSKTDGVDTGVATALSASMAGVAASGIGILGLLRKKRNKK